MSPGIKSRLFQRPMSPSAIGLPLDHDRQLPLDAGHDYLTLTYFRRTRGRGSPANTLPNLSTVPNSAPLPVVVSGLPPWSRMKYLTQPFRASPMRIPCSNPGLSTLSDSESNT